MNTFKEYIEEAAMSPAEALRVFGLTDFPKSSDELKQLHKKLALQNHPDRGGSLEQMKQVNVANDILKKNIGRSIRSGFTATGSSEPIKQKFGGMHTLRKYGKTFPRGEMPSELSKEEVSRKMRLHMLTFFNTNLKQDAFCAYLQSIVGQPFTSSITTRQGVKLDDVKESWMDAVFKSKDGKIVVNVAYTANTNKKAYKNRDELDGYYNKNDFEFEWKVSADIFVEGKKTVLFKPTKYERKGFAVLSSPATLLPQVKLKKALKI